MESPPAFGLAFLEALDLPRYGGRSHPPMTPACIDAWAIVTD